MEERIKTIVELQKLDSGIDNLGDSREELTGKFENLRQQFAESKKELEEMTASSKETEKRVRAKERELLEVGENLKKYRGSIYKVTSQKEMESLDHEIENAKEQKSRIEEEILSLMEKTEGLKEEIAKKEKGVKEKKRVFEKEEDGYEKEIKDIEDKLEQLNRGKKEVIDVIEERLLSQYKRLRESKGGLAVVAIKNGACQGCYLTLPPQLVNEIKSSKRITMCESCARILYWSACPPE